MKKSISTDFKREHIIELLRQMARKFNGKFDIRLIYTFGSFISEHRVPQSDVDTAILLGEGHDSYSIFRAAELFKLEILHKIQRKIDISILNIADPLLKHEVIVNGEIVFSRIDEEALFKFGRRTYQE